MTLAEPTSDVRVRFSPAPTGYLHVGSARSALFNWMYAARTEGTMILRVEDTDADRSQDELVQAIRDSLGWLGIDWHEEYRQSDRFDLYRAAAQDFVDRGLAYYCDCSQEDVKARIEAKGESGGYDSFCRDRGLGPAENTVVRFRTPTEGTTSYDDLIRGTVSFENDTLEDFVIVRSSGVPLFHVANAYDDLDMGITHVVRGEDLVNTVPRVLLLRQAMLGSSVFADREGLAEAPVFAHLPLIVNEQRKKLSKRRDDVSVGEFADRGFLPEAMRNYLLTLGWGPRDEGDEIRPIDELVPQFDLADINKAPAFFDIKKLEHFNGEYIRALPLDDFLTRVAPFVAEIDSGLFERMAPFVQGRLKRLDEAPSFLDWVVGDPREPEEKDWRKTMTKEKDRVPEVLDLVIERLADCPWEPEALEKAVFGVGEELGTKTQLPVRMALSGSRSGIPLFEPMVELDRDVVLDRLRAARAKV